MQLKHITHRSGGRITEIRHIAHDSYKGVASWHFIGTVEWEDDSRSQQLDISPAMLCADQENPEAQEELSTLMDAMNNYLADAGEWHDMKFKHGMGYSWTPKAPRGSRPIP